MRRYGFHGTSHRFVSARAGRGAGPAAGGRCAWSTLHLGNGCSAAAVRGGESVDTTMGLTPLEGLVMGTRSGDVDPGLLGYVAERLDLDVDGVRRRAQHAQRAARPVRARATTCAPLCEAAADGSATARLAIDVFCYRAAKAVGALAVALGGLDAVVFTGGIGEHSAEVRRRSCRTSACSGSREDPDANADARPAHRRAGEPTPATAWRSSYPPTRSCSSPATPLQLAGELAR